MCPQTNMAKQDTYINRLRNVNTPKIADFRRKTWNFKGQGSDGSIMYVTVGTILII